MGSIIFWNTKEGKELREIKVYTNSENLPCIVIRINESDTCDELVNKANSIWNTKEKGCITGISSIDNNNAIDYLLSRKNIHLKC